MEYELKYYYRVKVTLVLARQSFLKEPQKDEYEAYARKIIDSAYFLILNKIDELDGTNALLLENYNKIFKNNLTITLCNNVKYKRWR